jgi:hypothetical protein
MRRPDPTPPEPRLPPRPPREDEVHIVPTLGPEHVLSPQCWCHPERDSDVPLYLHNVAH